MSVIEAKFFTSCPSCDEVIRPGERIKPDPLDGGEGSWVHERCPEEPKPREVCTVCFLEKSVSGKCGCEEDA